MKVTGAGAARSVLLGLTTLAFHAESVVAFPQRTAYVNSTSSVSTTSAPVSETTPGPSLTRACSLWFPNEISLESWYTEHATLTVATEIEYYIQYNNTQVPANSSTRLDGILMTMPWDANGTSTINVIRQTNVAYLSETGLRAPQQFTIPGIPHDLISLVPNTTGYDYAMTKFHTNSEVTHTWGVNGTAQAVASPTPFVIPGFAVIYVDYYDGTEVVSSTVMSDFYQNGVSIGGPWHEPVDWPDQVTFTAVPTQFLEWMYEYPGVSTKIPWLSECTRHTISDPSGAPTVHVVMSTLTHKTKSVIATSPGNFGGVPTPSTKATTPASSPAKGTTSKIVDTTIIAVPTTSAKTEKTSDAPTSAQPTSEPSNDTPSTAVTSDKLTFAPTEAPTSDVEGSTGATTGGETKQTSQATTGGENGGTSQAPQPTTAENNGGTSEGSQPTSAQGSGETSEVAQPTTGDNNGGGSQAPQPTTAENNSGGSQAPQPTTAGNSDGNSQVPQPTTADNNEGGSQAPQPTTGDNNDGTTAPQPTGDNGGTSQASQQTSVGSNGGSSPAPTTADEGSNGGSQVSSAVTIPTNNQVHTGGSFTETQQAGTTGQNEGSGTGSTPEETGASQQAPTTANTAAQSNGGAVSSGAETTAVVAPVLTIGSTTVAPNSNSEYVVSSQTIAPGGSAVTLGETTYSLATSATALIENGQTQQITPGSTVAAVPQLTLGSTIVTANSDSAFVYESQTISAGGPAVTAGGNTYSITTSGSATYLVENGATQPAAQPTQAPEITFGSSVVAANSQSAFVVGSQTLSAGGSEIAVGETTYSLGTSGSSTFVVENGVTSALPAPVAATSAAPVVSVVTNAATPATPAITVGSSVITANSASEYVIGSQTLAPGSSAITADGTTYSLATSASDIVVNGATSPLSQNAATPAITVGSSVITANSASEYVIGEQTLAPGSSAITADGTTYSLASGGSAVVVNGATNAISQNVASETPAYVVAGQTLSQGSEIEVSGTTYSLAPSATAIVVNGQTSALPEASQPAVATFGSALATSVAGGYVIAGQTLSSGEAVTVSGTTYSLVPSNSAIVVDGVTSALPSAAAEAPVTIGSALATPVSSGNGYVIAGQTLQSDSAITVSGTTYSLAPSGSVVVNGNTQALPSPTVAPAYAIGSTTLTAGEAVTISGTTYSLSPSGSSAALIVNGETSTLPVPKAFTLDGQTYTAIPAASSGVVIGTQTLLPGDSVTITASGGEEQTLSLATNGVLETLEASGTGAAIISGLLGSQQTSTSLSGSRSVASRTSGSAQVSESAAATGSSSVSSAAGARKTQAFNVAAVAAVLGALVL